MTKNLLLILIVIVVLMGGFIWYGVSQYNDLKRENTQLTADRNTLSNNLIAANDSTKFWKTKAGDYLSERKILSATNEMLEDQYAAEREKYLDLVGKDKKKDKMIAYLEGQIIIKDSIIGQLSNDSTGGGSFIQNDSTIFLDIGKTYDSSNYYRMYGPIIIEIINNKITTGNFSLNTDFSIGLELGINRDSNTGMASIVSKTKFPAKVYLNGITEIERAINSEPSHYLGAAILLGYGATLQKDPVAGPFIGVGVYFSPKWLTIKIRK